MSSKEEGKFLSYNGEVLVFELSRRKSSGERPEKTSRLHVRKMAFERGTRTFVQQAAEIFSLHGKHFSVEMVCCSCTVDCRTGINLPCILIRKEKKKSVFKYFLLLLHSSNKFEQRLAFKLDYELQDDVKLLAGPSVLWRHSSAFFYISSQTATVVSAPVLFSSIKWAGDIENLGTVILGVREAHPPMGESSQAASQSDAAIWGTEFFAYSIERKETLTGACFLPHAYGTVVTCLHVCAIEVVDKQLRTSVVAVTCKNQLIWFQDGLPQNICQLPFENPYEVQVMASVGGDFFIVFFESNNVCAVWKNDFQVTSKWQNVKSVLVDDFTGSGTEQILLIFEDEFNPDCLTTFRITNLSNINYSSDSFECEEDASPEDQLQENRSLMIQALETRLQVGLAGIEELKQHLHLKDKVIMKSCRALVELARGKEYTLGSAEEEGLVSLWDDPEQPLHPIEKPSDTSPDLEHLVEKLWHRVVDDRLVVGLKLKYSPVMSLTDVTLYLLMDEPCGMNSPLIECQNKVIKLKTESFSATSFSVLPAEPEAKRIKLAHPKKEGENNYDEQQLHSDCIQMYTAVTSLSPLLVLHNFCCVVLLHAQRRENEETTGKDQGLAMPCGRVFINLDDLSSGKYSVKLSRKNSSLTGFVEDLFATLAVFDKFCFQITSPDYKLTSVAPWLIEDLECELIKEFPGHLLCKKPGDVQGTLFNWSQKMPFEGILEVFCRNQTVLFQCLHDLTKVLPPGCVVKQLKYGSKGSLTDHLALGLEKEMVTLRSLFSSAVSEAAQKLALSCDADPQCSSDTVAASSLSEEVVQQYRDKFQKEKEQSMLGMNLTISGAHYREITWKLAEIQLKSDRDAQKLDSL
ncbi:Fanconi anemia group B protein [Ornithorhynchus anatinus]|uniref:FA complementation group B n=1 Tax=Ornithorhynchus anatinus TaxID=9258 RepID=F7E8N2_ORNAN|nr:Fanconi anemia group B protein [Ornithorhynchus anatinus]XP_007668605.2 Fanconi anemia group B protein [Ornithorhynchus anatinus]